ncbi:MAG: hypothetical protein WA384_05435, partial [Rhodomicrobium sp.]
MLEAYSLKASAGEVAQPEIRAEGLRELACIQRIEWGHTAQAARLPKRNNSILYLFITLANKNNAVQLDGTPGNRLERQQSMV